MGDVVLSVSACSLLLKFPMHRMKPTKCNSTFDISPSCPSSFVIQCCVTALYTLAVPEQEVRICMMFQN